MRFGPDINTNQPATQEEIQKKFLAKPPRKPRPAIDLGLEPIDINPPSRPGEDLTGDIPGTRFTPARSNDPLVATMEVYDARRYGRPTHGQVNDPDRQKFRDVAADLIQSGKAAGKASDIYFQVSQAMGQHEMDPEHPSQAQQRSLQPYTLENAMAAYDIVKYGQPTYGYVNDAARQALRDRLAAGAAPEQARDDLTVDSNEINRLSGRALDQPGSFMPHEINPADVVNAIYTEFKNDPAALKRLDAVQKSGFLSQGFAGGMSPEVATSMAGKVYDPVMSPQGDMHPFQQTLQNLFAGGMARAEQNPVTKAMLGGIEALPGAPLSTSDKDILDAQRGRAASLTPYGVARDVGKELAIIAPYMVPSVGHRLFATDIAGALVAAKNPRELLDTARGLVPIDQAAAVFDESKTPGERIGAAFGFGLFVYGTASSLRAKLSPGARMPETPKDMSVKDWESAIKAVYPTADPASVRIWGENTYKAQQQGVDPAKPGVKEGFEYVTSLGKLPEIVGQRRAPAEQTVGPVDEPTTQVLKPAEPGADVSAQTIDNIQAPYTHGTLPADQINVDPRVQYKTVDDTKSMTTSKLKGIDTFDLGQAGELSVWQKNDGTYAVVHGHHRLELAQRAGKFGYFGPGGEFVEVPRNLRVRVLKEADGWTLPDVRVHAAMENLRNGDGTALDAVSALREAGVTSTDYKDVAEVLANRGVALKGALARDTAGLLAASDELLHNVKIGQVDGSVAAGVASVEGLPREQQVHAGLAAEKNGARTFEDGKRFGLNYKDSLEWGTATQDSLFGDEPAQVSTLTHQYQVEQGARRSLRAELSKLRGSLKFEPLNEKEFVDKDARREFLNSVASGGDIQYRIDRIFEKFGDIKDLRRQLGGEVARGEKTSEKASAELAKAVIDTLRTARQREYVEGRPGASEPPEGRQVDVAHEQPATGDESGLFDAPEPTEVAKPEPAKPKEKWEESVVDYAQRKMREAGHSEEAAATITKPEQVTGALRSQWEKDMRGWVKDGKPVPEEIRKQLGDDAREKPEGKFMLSKDLSREEKLKLLAQRGDAYVDNGVDKIFKGLDRNGEEIYGFPHSPEAFHKSDSTGRGIRHYVVLEGGKRVHISDVFPDLSERMLSLLTGEDGKPLDNKTEEQAQKWAKSGGHPDNFSRAMSDGSRLWFNSQNTYGEGAVFHSPDGRLAVGVAPQSQPWKLQWLKENGWEVVRQPEHGRTYTQTHRIDEYGQQRKLPNPRVFPVQRDVKPTPEFLAEFPDYARQIAKSESVSDTVRRNAQAVVDWEDAKALASSSVVRAKEMGKPRGEKAPVEETPAAGAPKQEAKPAEPIEPKIKKARPKSVKEFRAANDDWIAKYEAKKKGKGPGKTRGAVDFGPEDFEYVARKAVKIILDSAAKSTLTVTEAARKVAKEIGLPDSLFHEVADRIQDLQSHVSDQSAMKHDRAAKTYGNKRAVSDAFAIDDEHLSSARKAVAAERRTAKKAAIEKEAAQGLKPLGERLFEHFSKTMGLEPGAEKSHDADLRTRFDKAAAWLQANPGKPAEDAPKNIRDLTTWAEAAREGLAETVKTGRQPASGDRWAPSMQERQAAARVAAVQKAQSTLEAVMRGEVKAQLPPDALQKSLGIDAGKGGITDIGTQLDIYKKSLEKLKKSMAEESDPFRDPEVQNKLLDDLEERVAQLTELKAKVDADPNYTDKIKAELQSKADAEMLSRAQKALEWASSPDTVHDDISDRVQAAALKREDIPAAKIDELPADSKSAVQGYLDWLGYKREGDAFVHDPQIDAGMLFDRSFRATTGEGQNARVKIAPEAGGAYNVHDTLKEFDEGIAKALDSLGRGQTPNFKGTTVKGSKGVFMVDQQTRWTRQATNLVTSVHEFGHWLHDAFLGKILDETDKELLDGPFRSTERGANNRSGKQKERIAELVLAYASDPAYTKEIAPKSVQWLLENTPKEILAPYELIGQRMRQYIGADELARRAAHVYTTPQEATLVEKMGRVADVIKNLGENADESGQYKTPDSDKIRALLTSRQAPFRSAVKELFKRSGYEQGRSRNPELPEGLAPSENPIVIASEIPYHTERLVDTTMRGLPSIDGVSRGPSMRDWMSALEPHSQADLDLKTKEAAAYSAAHRQLEIYDNKQKWAMSEIGRRSALEADKAAMRLEKAKADAEAVAKAYVKSADRVISQKRAKEMRKATTPAQKARVKAEAEKLKAQARSEAEALATKALAKMAKKIEGQYDRRVARISNVETARATRDAARAVPDSIGQTEKDSEVIARAKRTVEQVQSHPVKGPMYEQWRRMHQDMADRLLDHMIDFNLLSEDQAKLMRDKNQHYYALNRSERSLKGDSPDDLMHNWIRGEGAGAGGSSKLGSSERPVRKRKGSQKELADPYEHMLAFTDRVLRHSHSNMAALTFARLAETGRSFHGEDARTGDIVAWLPDTPPGEGAHPFDNGSLAPIPHESGGTVFTVFDEGVKRRFLVSDPALGRAMTEMMGGMSDPVTNRLMTFLGTGARLLRTGVVLTPPFAARNFLRDTFTRVFLDRYREAPKPPTKESTIRKVEDFKKGWADYERLGIGLGQTDVFKSGKKWEKAVQEIRKDIVYENLSERRVLRAKEMPAVAIHHAWESYKGALEAVEKTNRNIVFGNAKRYFIDELKMSPREAERAAAMEARQTMTDFRDYGAAVSVLNKVSAFLGPRVKGVATAGTRLKDSPQARRQLVFWTVAMFAAKKIWDQMSGTEGYDERLSQPQRDLFVNFHTKDGPPLSIPMPHELGLLYTALDRTWDHYNNDSPYSLGDFTNTAMNVLMPVDENNMAGPVQVPVELMANYSFFRKQRIVSPFEENLDVELRSGARHASPLGKALYQFLAPGVQNSQALSQMLDDPRKVDYLLQSAIGNTGSLATEVSRLTDGTRSVGDVARKFSGLSNNSSTASAGQVPWVDERLRSAGVSRNPFKSLSEQYYNTDDPRVKSQMLQAIVDLSKQARKMLEEARQKYDKPPLDFSRSNKEAKQDDAYYAEVRRIAAMVEAQATAAARG